VSPSSPAPTGGSNPVTGEVVIYPWLCPYCIRGEWEDGVPCPRCDGRGLTDDVTGFPADQRQLAPRPPAVMSAACTDCRFQPDCPQSGEPFWCHQGMPTGANDVLSPVAWAAGMPLGYVLCARWWTAAVEQLEQHADPIS
jgi:hypothetical protein